MFVFFSSNLCLCFWFLKFSARTNATLATLATNFFGFVFDLNVPRLSNRLTMWIRCSNHLCVYDSWYFNEIIGRSRDSTHCMWIVCNFNQFVFFLLLIFFLLLLLFRLLLHRMLNTSSLSLSLITHSLRKASIYQTELYSLTFVYQLISFSFSYCYFISSCGCSAVVGSDSDSLLTTFAPLLVYVHTNHTYRSDTLTEKSPHKWVKFCLLYFLRSNQDTVSWLLLALVWRRNDDDDNPITFTLCFAEKWPSKQPFRTFVA